MNGKRNFLHYLAQAIDQYRAERAASAGEAAPQSQGAEAVRGVLHWLMPK